jgi:hypothetical protein
VVRFYAGARDFSLLQSDQTGSDAPCDTYAVGTESSLFICKAARCVKLTTCCHLLLGLKMTGAMCPPPPPTHLCTEGKHKDNVTFPSPYTNYGILLFSNTGKSPNKKLIKFDFAFFAYISSLNRCTKYRPLLNFFFKF